MSFSSGSKSPSSFKPTKTKAESAPTKESSSSPSDVTNEAPPLPEPASLAQSTGAQVDWDTARQAAESVTSKMLTETGAQLTRVGKAFGEATDLEGRSHQSLVAALIGLFEVSVDLLKAPGVVCALAHQRQLKLTKATLASASLPVVKLSVPDLDPKTQSLYANAVNFALACEYDAAGFRTALEAHGVKSLAKHEAARKRAAAGEPAQPTDEALVESFRNGRDTVLVEGIDIPEGVEMALAIVGWMNGEVHLFAIDDDPKRLLAAIRKAAGEGREPPSVEMAKAAKKNAGNNPGNDRSAGEAAA